MSVREDDHVRRQLLPDGRYDEARGRRRSAYRGRYEIRGGHIDHWDDTGLTAEDPFVDANTLNHGGMVFRREKQGRSRLRPAARPAPAGPRRAVLQRRGAALSGAGEVPSPPAAAGAASCGRRTIMSAQAKRVAIVTGASRGIGAAIATRLAQDVFAVILITRAAPERRRPWPRGSSRRAAPPSPLPRCRRSRDLPAPLRARWR